MRVSDEYTWEGDYWDEYRREFGLDAYMKARYDLGSPEGPTYSTTEPCQMCGEVHPV